MRIFTKALSLSLLLLSLLSFSAFGADKGGNGDWKFISPRPSDIVKSGQLVVLVEIDSTVEVIPGSVQVFLDELMINTAVKVSNHRLSFLYEFPLKQGRHTIELKGKGKKAGWLGGIITEFTVGIPSSGIVDESGAVLKQRDPKAGLEGNLSIDTRITQISGSGSELRQEPSYTSTINLDATARAGKVYFPLKFYGTSDEFTYPKGIQSRNYMMAGMQSRHVELYAGDLNPNFDKLVLTGTRIHGASATFMLRRISLQVLHGYSSRAIEGNRFQYDGTGPVPSNMQEDSSYLSPGNYRRDISAARLQFGSKEEGSSLSFMVLKGKDAAGSIKYGQSPAENLVAGVENSFITTNNKLRFTAGAAFSLYTDDISRGVISKHELDSTFGRDLGMDPEKYDNFISINSSTTPPGKSSAAYYTSLSLRDKRYSTVADYRYMGSAYRSFGNPYARTDQMQAGLRQQVFFWKKKLALNGRYRYEKYNLFKTQPSTINGQLISAGFTLTPGAKIPAFNFSYSTLGRKSADDATSRKPRINDVTNTISGGLNYDLITGNLLHHVTLQGQQSNRTDKRNENNTLDYRNYVAGYGLDIRPLNVNLSAQANRGIYVFTAGPKPLYDYFSGSIGYALPKYKLRVGANAGVTKYYETEYSSASRRTVLNINASTDFLKNFTFYLEGGTAPYHDLAIPSNDYNETYIYGRLIYNFIR
jgi:hypothetical protein